MLVKMKYVLIILFFLISPNSYADWKKIVVNQDGSAEHFIDFDTYKKINNQILVWELVNYHKKLLPTGEPIHSAKNLLEVNCAEGKMRYKTSLYYGSTHGKGKLISLDNKGSGRWFYDAPGTTGYKELKAICKY